jgi:hypothetical protein
VAAVRLGEPDLAAGDLFGSSLANMVVLAIVDLYPPRGRLLRDANPAHAVTAAQAIVLNALAAMCVLQPTGATLQGVGPGPLLLFTGYLLGTRVLFRSAAPAPIVADRRAPPVRDVLAFVVAAVVVLVAATAFARSAPAIAEASGLGATFVGTWLVGLSTSLAELVACITAVRMRALDLAIGIAAMGYRRDRTVPLVDPDSVLILVGYVVGVVLIYTRAACHRPSRSRRDPRWNRRCLTRTRPAPSAPGWSPTHAPPFRAPRRLERRRARGSSRS